MASIQLGAALRHVQRLFDSGTPAGLDDAQLLDRFLDRRDEDAFAALVDRHGPLVLATCRALLRDPHDADDAFQATFLTLARKAGSIRDPAILGGWLHRVARRVAIRANVDAKRRRCFERRAGPRSAAPSSTPTAGLGALLHEEIDRLPERLRLPLVLCHLEEIPQAQAAVRLRWSERTLRRRLAEARDRLRLRLERRGIDAPAGMLAAALAREARAAVPGAWAEAAARAATGGAAAAPSAVALAAGTLRALAPAKLKTVAALALGAAAVALGVGVRDAGPGPIPGPGRDGAPIPTAHARAAAPQDADAKEAKAEANAKADPASDGSVAFRGRVLDPRGRPVAGAKLSLSYDPAKDPGGPAVRATSGPDGGFRFEVPEALFDANYEDEPWKGVDVVARVEGYGLGIGPRAVGDGTPTLRLAEDLPIAGRVLDLQGRPVAGISVRPLGIEATERGDLDPILRAYTDGKAAAEDPPTARIFAGLSGQVPTAVTGADGRFRLAGIGRERLVGVMIEGPGIETAYAQIMTRRAATIRVARPGDIPRTLYGAEFEHIAGPSQPIVGVVRDADTGAPVEGAKVDGNHPANIHEINAVTDREGRYRLDGLPAGRRAHLSVVAPAGRPYLRAARFVPNDQAGRPTDVPFSLKRGLWIAGRVTDRATGRPVRAQVDYFAFPDNPHLGEAPHFSDDSRTELKWTAPDGSYRVAGLPGRGLIAVKAHAREDYCVGVGAGAIRGDDPIGTFPTRPGFCLAVNYNVLAEVNPAEGAGDLACDLAVDPGRSVGISVLDPDGMPLAGAVVVGRARPWFDWPLAPQPAAGFAVERLAPGESRTLTILHDGRKLAAGLTVGGDGDAPDPDGLSVRLRPWGVVTGRVVDDQGEPRAGVAIRGMDRPRYDPTTGGVGPSVPVGEDGRFRIEGLVPGRKYTLGVVKGHYGQGTVAEDLTLEPGEARDLGDVRPRTSEK